MFVPKECETAYEKLKTERHALRKSLQKRIETREFERRKVSEEVVMLAERVDSLQFELRRRKNTLLEPWKANDSNASDFSQDEFRKFNARKFYEEYNKFEEAATVEIIEKNPVLNNRRLALMAIDVDLEELRGQLAWAATPSWDTFSINWSRNEELNILYPGRVREQTIHDGEIQQKIRDDMNFSRGTRH